MKRLFCAFMITLLVILGSATAFAEDLASLSFDELLEKRQANDLVLLATDDYPSFKVTQGTYTVDIDFPAGIYNISSQVLSELRIYDDAGNLLGDYTDVKGTPLNELALDPGNRVQIDGGTLIFTKVQVIVETAGEGDPIATKAALDEALKSSNGYTSFTLSQGTYTVGKDISAGTYTVSSMMLSAFGLFHGDPSDESNLDIMYSVTMNEAIGKIELTEGTIVSMSGMDVTVTTYTGIAY